MGPTGIRILGTRGFLQPAKLLELLVVAQSLDAELGHQLEVDTGVGLLGVNEGHVLQGLAAFVRAGKARLVVDGSVGATVAYEAVLKFAS